MNDHTQHELDTHSLVKELNSLATLCFIAVENEIFSTELERQHLMATLCCAAKGVVFQTWISYQNPKFISVDKQANNDVMHFVEFGETNRLSD